MLLFDLSFIYSVFPLIAECDTCVTLLLDDLTILDHNITTALEDLDSIAVGAGAIRRLERINMTVAELRVGLMWKNRITSYHIVNRSVSIAFGMFFFNFKDLLPKHSLSQFFFHITCLF